ncbi:MAG: energy-coupling factor transporter ATPase [Chloroflexi bacterium]|nr:energy-coupling factor transporter ATPase [Chloroflexota bacterium]
MTEPILRVENVHYTYGPDSTQPIHALRGVSFQIHRGEYVAIIGHNGSGKSTLAKHLNGLLLPTQGDVWVKDWNTKDKSHRLDVRTMVGMVFQSPDNQIVATIVEEDVAFGPENLGVPHVELRARVDWALDTVEMQEYRRRAPHLLSGGQKQRVAIAGILAMKPKVLVLDESTALLDPLGRDEVLRVARRLNDEGTTIVAITHFMREAALADRVIVLEAGQIALEGTPRGVFSQAERLRELQLDVPEITQLAHRLHARCETFPRDVLSVEEFVDAFIENEGVRGRGGEGENFGPSHAHTPILESPPHSLTPSPTSVSVRHLQHTYLRGTPLESVALRKVNLDVQRGEVVGIIGHTGSGKSTLIQHLNGLMRPQSGEVCVLDFDLRDPKLDARALRRRVGLVFQFPEAQLFEQHVGDDVAFGPWQMGLRGDELRGRVREALEAVGLPFDSFKDRALHSLSGGERRRVALAGVLACKPEVLILDEPTAGLDPRGHQDILERIVTLKREWGTTLVIVSHNMEEIARLCDRVYVLADGQSVLSGNPRQIFTQPQRLTELGLGVPQVTAAMHALRARGINVREDALTVEEAVAVVSEQLTVNSEQ